LPFVQRDAFAAFFLAALLALPDTRFGTGCCLAPTLLLPPPYAVTHPGLEITHVYKPMIEEAYQGA
jgi:hypothetical protein